MSQLVNSRQIPGDSPQGRNGLPVEVFVVRLGPGAELDDHHVAHRVDEQVLAVDAEAGERRMLVIDGPPLVGVAVVVVTARTESADREARRVAAAAAAY